MPCWPGSPARSAIGTGNDDATYLLLARSVRHWEYVDRHLVNMPVHSQYPPGYPAILVCLAVSRTLDQSGACCRLWSSSLLGLWLAFDVARRVMPVGLYHWDVGPNGGQSPPPRVCLGRFEARSLYHADSVHRLVALDPGQPDSCRRLVHRGAVLAALTRSIWCHPDRRTVSLVVVRAPFSPGRQCWRGFRLVTVGAWIVWNFLAPDQFASRSYGALARAQPRGISGTRQSLCAPMSRSSRTTSAGAYRPPSACSDDLPGMVVDNILWVVVVFGPGRDRPRSRHHGGPSPWRRTSAFATRLPRALASGSPGSCLPMIPFVLLLISRGAAVLDAAVAAKVVASGVRSPSGAFIVAGCLGNNLPNLKAELGLSEGESAGVSGPRQRASTRSLFALARYVRRTRRPPPSSLRPRRRPSPSTRAGRSRTRIWPSSSLEPICCPSVSARGIRVHRSLAYYPGRGCRSAFSPCAAASKQ